VLKHLSLPSIDCPLRPRTKGRVRQRIPDLLNYSKTFDRALIFRCPGLLNICEVFARQLSRFHAKFLKRLAPFVVCRRLLRQRCSLGAARLSRWRWTPAAKIENLQSVCFRRRSAPAFHRNARETVWIGKGNLILEITWFKRNASADLSLKEPLAAVRMFRILYRSDVLDVDERIQLSYCALLALLLNQFRDQTSPARLM